MIQSNELRLGNWVNTPRKDHSPFRIDSIEYCTKDYCQVGMSTIEGGHPLTWDNKDIDSISLTEDLIIRAGFIKADSKYKYYYHPKTVLFALQNVSDLEGEIKIVVGRTSSFSFLLISIEIKYLHHLQNVFYSLTGEELNIEL